MSIIWVSDEYQMRIRRVSDEYHAYQTSIRRVSDEYQMSISRVSVEYQTSIMRIWCCDAYQALKRFILAQTRINYPKRSFASCSFLARQKQQNFSLAIDCFTLLTRSKEKACKQSRSRSAKSRWWSTALSNFRALSSSTGYKISWPLLSRSCGETNCHEYHELLWVIQMYHEY